ncbi:MAG: aminotransferase class I/II-fold pyridoxal phosphate-dependent enzyme [Candidatus Omnitrophica bacterium]|nr:aminotransferase class I/II-fold pyridoxal phosphate-dependent enzyme [Candidatus Omnitrophota bacterium]
MGKFQWSKRLQDLPPYLFAEIDRKKGELRKKKVNFIDLSIGDPDILAPKQVNKVLYDSAKIKANQKYALDQGKPEFKKTIKSWFKKRFNVSLDVDSEILPLIGSKEGLVHFPLGFVNPGDYVLIPSPGYPGYRSAALFAGANAYEVPLLAENNFLPDLDKIPLKVRNKAKLIYLNYPNNPTTAIAPLSFLRKVVKFCAKYGIIIAYDNAYSEVYFDKKPHSIFEVKGAKEVAVGFHSHSKTFCMTGFRVGWACGGSELIKGLAKVKANLDSGIFSAVQDAAAYALSNEADYVNRLRKTIKNRRDVFVKGLRAKGFKDIHADSTFYVWAKLPKGNKSSIDFAKELMKKGIVATPGLGFGKYGEGYIRFALTVDVKCLKEAINLL